MNGRLSAHTMPDAGDDCELSEPRSASAVKAESQSTQDSLSECNLPDEFESLEMVYYGELSRGCEGCRKRKIKVRPLVSLEDS